MKKKIIAIAMAASMVLSLCNVAMAADETITYTADFSTGSTTAVTGPAYGVDAVTALTNPEGTWKASLGSNIDGSSWSYQFDNTYAYVNLPNIPDYRGRFDFYPTDTVKSLQKIEFDVTSKGAPAISTMFGIQGKKTYYHLSVSGWSSSGTGGNVSLLKNGFWTGDTTYGTNGESLATATVGTDAGTSAWPNGTDFKRHITIELTSSKIKYTVANSDGSSYTNEVDNATGADTYTSGQPLVSIMANRGQTQVKYSNVKLTYTRGIPATYTADFTSSYTSGNPIHMTAVDTTTGTYLVGNATDGGWKAYCNGINSNGSYVDVYSNGTSAVVYLKDQNDNGTLSYITPDKVKTVSRIEYELVSSNYPNVEMTMGGKYKLRMAGWNQTNGGKSIFYENGTALDTADSSETGWPNNGQTTTKKVAIDFNGTAVNYTVKTKNNGANSGAEYTRTGTAALSAPVSVDADAPLMSFFVSRGSATVTIKNVKIWYETEPEVVPVNVTKAEDGTVSATVTLSDKSGTGVAILAIFNGSTLVKAEDKAITNVAAGETVTFTNKVGAGQTAKVFIWNSLAQVAPLHNVTSVN